MVIIGIDPSFRKNGFAVCFWDLTDNSMSFQVYGCFLEFYDFIKSDDAPVKAVVVIENSNLQNTTFDLRGNKNEVARKSRNVGTNQAVSELTVRACVSRYGKKSVLELSPRQKGRKLKQVEIDSLLQMNKIKAQSRMNQDMRDAAQLALRGEILSKRILTMNNKQKKIILKNAIIALINVLHSVIFEALP